MKARTVYPVEGFFLNDVPAVEHECTDARCVESGAFTDQPPPRTKAQATERPAETGGPSDSESKE